MPRHRPMPVGWYEYVPALRRFSWGTTASIAGADPHGAIVAAAFRLPVVSDYRRHLLRRVHDYSALLASSRHEGKSVGDCQKKCDKAGPLLLFSWLALLLVVATLPFSPGTSL